MKSLVVHIFNCKFLSTQALADGTVIETERTGIEETDGVRVTESVKINGAQVLGKFYHKNGLTESVSDSVSGFVRYLYDDYKNVTQVKSDDLTEDYTYNEYGELTQKALSGAVDQAYTYAYKDNSARDLEYVGTGDYKFYPLSDVNGRNTGREIVNGTAKIAGEYITYRKVGDHATNMPASIWFASGTSIKDSIKVQVRFVRQYSRNNAERAPCGKI